MITLIEKSSNMKNQISSLAMLIVVLFFLPACSKKTNPPPQKTKTELISTSTWKFSAATVGGADASAFLQPCQKDNILSFQSNGNGSVDEGLTKCNSGDPQTNPFTWGFTNSESILHVSTILFTGGSTDFTLVSLTETQLVVSQNVTISGPSQTAVVTFIH